MIEWKPEELAAWTGGSWQGNLPSQPLGAFCHDSRKLQAGEIFVALTTGRRDGHDFLRVAQEAGAAGAIVARPNFNLCLPQLVVADPLAAMQEVAAIWRRAFPGPVIGITGSCGKTTARSILSELLGPACHATTGNQNNGIGVPLTLTGLDPREHDYAVVEAGIDRPGEMAVLAQMIRPTLTLFTNIGDAHLDRLGNREGVAAEKSRLGWENAATAVLGYDSLRYAPFSNWPGITRVLYPHEARASGDRWSLEPPAIPLTQRIRLTTEEWGEGTFDLASASEGVAHTAALCLMVASHIGIEAREARARLAHWRPLRQRGEVIVRNRQTFYVDCYNSNPAALRDALVAFRSCAGRQPCCFVLGAMKELGADSARLHREAVRDLTLAPLDRLIAIGEEARAFADAVLANGAEAHQLTWVAQASDARPTLETFEGWVLLKGSRACALETLLPNTPTATAPC